MTDIDTLRKHRDAHVSAMPNKPVMNIFEEQLQLGDFFSDYCFTDLSFSIGSSGGKCVGIENLGRQYYKKKLILSAPTGSGKSTVFEYLYIQGIKPEDGEDPFIFYYTHASTFAAPASSLLAYPKEIREVFENQEHVEGLFLIDGFEEAFTGREEEAVQWLNKIASGPNAVWIACRPEFLVKLGHSFRTGFDATAEIQTWSYDNFDALMKKYAEQAGYAEAAERVRAIAERIAGKDTKSIVYRPLYATMMLLVEKEEPGSLGEITDINEYRLFEKFVDLWFARELNGKPGDFETEKETHINNLTDIALRVYSGESFKSDDDQILAFLDITPIAKKIKKFHLQEFRNYFIARGMLRAARSSDSKAIVSWYAKTFFDADIFDLFKKSLRDLGDDDLEEIFNHLFNEYKRTFDETDNVKDELNTPKNENLQKLRFHLYACIMRLPLEDTTEMTSAGGFSDYVDNHLNDLTKDFRNKKPKATSWTGFIQSELRQLKNDDEDSRRTRFLDLQLLQAYYAGTKYHDCTSCEAFRIIKNCQVNCGAYPDAEEKAKNAKKELITSYKNHLLSWAVKKDASYDRSRTAEDYLSQNEDHILETFESIEIVDKSLQTFWASNKKELMENCEDKKTDIGSESSYEDFKKALGEGNRPVIIMTANRIEGITVTKLLDRFSSEKPIHRYTTSHAHYQLATVDDVQILHIWPHGTSSFTVHGSFNALMEAIKHYGAPKYVFSVGVAFGGDPRKEDLGDVLISDKLVFYDAFNKRTDGSFTLKSEVSIEVGGRILNVCGSDIKDDPTRPFHPPVGQEKIGDFRWFIGPMLSGGTVLSDSDEKILLTDAANNLGSAIIGGEMEGGGIYFACNSVDPAIPFVIVKGICDWGANKNGWEFAVKESNKNYDSSDIKDCVQELACRNAFAAARFIISKLKP